MAFSAVPHPHLVSRPKHVTLAALERGGGSEGVWPHPRARLLRNYCTPTVLPAVLWELRT